MERVDLGLAVVSGHPEDSIVLLTESPGLNPADRNVGEILLNATQDNLSVGGVSLGIGEACVVLSTDPILQCEVSFPLVNHVVPGADSSEAIHLITDSHYVALSSWKDYDFILNGTDVSLFIDNTIINPGDLFLITSKSALNLQFLTNLKGSDENEVSGFFIDGGGVVSLQEVSGHAYFLMGDYIEVGDKVVIGRGRANPGNTVLVVNKSTGVISSKVIGGHGGWGYSSLGVVQNRYVVLGAGLTMSNVIAVYDTTTDIMTTKTVPDGEYGFWGYGDNITALNEFAIIGAAVMESDHIYAYNCQTDTISRLEAYAEVVVGNQRAGVNISAAWGQSSTLSFAPYGVILGNSFGFSGSFNSADLIDNLLQPHTYRVGHLIVVYDDRLLTKLYTRCIIPFSPLQVATGITNAMLVGASGIAPFGAYATAIVSQDVIVDYGYNPPRYPGTGRIFRFHFFCPLLYGGQYYLPGVDGPSTFGFLVINCTVAIRVRNGTGVPAEGTHQTGSEVEDTTTYITTYPSYQSSISDWDGFPSSQYYANLSPTIAEHGFDNVSQQHAVLIVATPRMTVINEPAPDPSDLGTYVPSMFLGHVWVLYAGTDYDNPLYGSSGIDGTDVPSNAEHFWLTPTASGKVPYAVGTNGSTAQIGNYFIMGGCALYAESGAFFDYIHVLDYVNKTHWTVDIGEEADWGDQGMVAIGNKVVFGRGNSQGVTIAVYDLLTNTAKTMTAVGTPPAYWGQGQILAVGNKVFMGPGTTVNSTGILVYDADADTLTYDVIDVGTPATWGTGGMRKIYPGNQIGILASNNATSRLAVLDESQAGSVILV